MQILRAVIIHLVVFVIAGLITWAAGDGGQQLATGQFTIFAGCMLIAFVIQWIAFIPAYINKTEHFYDLVGGLTYLTVVGFAYMQSEGKDLRSLLLSGLIAIWAIRLAVFLFLRVRKQGSDRRFDEIKLSFCRFLIAWTVQGLWVLITAGAALAAITTSEKVALGWIGILGAILWIIGFGIEVIADGQKRIFKQQKNHQGEFIKTGLWAYSRHPNYFGEILLWIGIAVIAYPALHEWQVATLISPIFVIVLLVKISGLPMLEEQADKRWGDNASYQSYKNSTPVLVPKLFR